MIPPPPISLLIQILKPFKVNGKKENKVYPEFQDREGGYGTQPRIGRQSHGTSRRIGRGSHGSTSRVGMESHWDINEDGLDL